MLAYFNDVIFIIVSLRILYQSEQVAFGILLIEHVMQHNLKLSLVSNKYRQLYQDNHH